jgi:hypothetical protein
MSFGPLGSNPIGSPRMLAIGPGAKPVRKIAFELRQRSITIR